MRSPKRLLDAEQQAVRGIVELAVRWNQHTAGRRGIEAEAEAEAEADADGTTAEDLRRTQRHSRGL